MKKRFSQYAILIIALCLFLATVCFVSCSKDEDEGTGTTQGTTTEEVTTTKPLFVTKAPEPQETNPPAGDVTGDVTTDGVSGETTSPIDAGKGDFIDWNETVGA